MTDRQKAEFEREQELQRIKKEGLKHLNNQELSAAELARKLSELSERYAEIVTRDIPVFLIALSTAACNISGSGTINYYGSDSENSDSSSLETLEGASASTDEASVAEGGSDAIVTSTTLVPSDHMWLMNSVAGGMTEYYNVDANPVKGVMRIKQNTQAVLQFDISELDGTVTNARLQMKMKSSSMCGGSASSFEDMLDVIGSVQISVMDRSYMNQLDYNAVSRETFNLVNTVPAALPYDNYYFIDLTEVVNEAVQAGESTFSLRIHPEDENNDSEINYQHVCFEFNDTTIGPKIEITLEQ